MSVDRESVERLIAKLDGVEQTGPDQWEAKCPARDGQHARLCVSRGNLGIPLVKCRAGCSLWDVLAKIGLTMADLFPKGNGDGWSQAPTIEPPTAKAPTVKALPPSGTAGHGAAVAPPARPTIRPLTAKPPTARPPLYLCITFARIAAER